MNEYFIILNKDQANSSERIKWQQAKVPFNIVVKKMNILYSVKLPAIENAKLIVEFKCDPNLKWFLRNINRDFTADFIFHHMLGKWNSFSKPFFSTFNYFFIYVI